MISLMTSLFKGEPDHVVVQFFRYFVMGGLSFLVDFATLYVLYRYGGLHYLAAATAGSLLGLATIYTCSILWVFNERTVKNPCVEFALFAFLGLVGLGVTLLMMFLQVDLLDVPVVPAKLISAAVAFVWNFGSRKLLLFTAFSPKPA
jgi:putative flippase GtrA